LKSIPFLCWNETTYITKLSIDFISSEFGQ
jgi:hypothetical protein